MIHYEVIAQKPASHLFNIRMTLPKALVPHQVSMPIWIPGSYLVRDFARHIVTIEAFALTADKKTKIAIQKINSNTWVCEKTNEAVVIEYTVYAWDTSVRGAHLDENHAFFNFCCLCLQYDKEMPCEVTINPPNCAGADLWRVATTLTPVDAKPWGYGRYGAANYDELIDHPVEIGNFDVVEFDVGQVPHAIVISGKHDGDLQRLAKDVEKICLVHSELFGNERPFSRYLFLLNIVKEGYGGLEHRSSTALLASREMMPLLNDTSTSRQYINLLALFSHEYFHAWNIKKIKPESFMPYNLSEKGYTHQLWAFEGITSYYDELALLRAKVITFNQYLDLLAQSLTKVLRNPGSFVQTLADSSFDAWIKFYQPNENTANSQVSYYLKGSLAAIAFDLTLRASTQNKKSLDGVMQTLWQEYGKPSIGVPEGKIEELIIQEGTEDIALLVKDAIYTTKVLPMDKLLAPFGLSVTLRQQQGADDMGGKRAFSESTFKAGIFQFTLTKFQSRLIVSTLIENGAAMQAGLSATDEIVAINGLRVDAESFDKIGKRLSVGQKVKVHYFRQDSLKETTVTLVAPPFDTAEITKMENMSETQKTNLKQWLNLE